MSEPVDQEVQAIRAVLNALTPLSDKARSSVLEYVTRRLNITAPSTSTDQPAVPPPAPPPPAESPSTQPPHIKDFKDTKKPRSANEMAAMVAYYLANVAPAGQRKATVNQKDIETHFKIASFPLPDQVRFTLPNAKNAGYFDLVGDGEYKLNAVGHNLVAHTMPRSGGGKKKTTVTRTKGQKKKVRSSGSRRRKA